MIVPSEYDAIAAFLGTEGLPHSYATTIARLYSPLAEYISRRARASGRYRLVGLCGPQGGGKTTLVAALRLLLEARGLRTAVLSIDDLYWPREYRLRLAADVHPLLATRGPPGTHDIDLGHMVIDQLSRQSKVVIPRFDKSSDTRHPPSSSDVFEGPADIVLFEGWCVGALAQSDCALASPVNALEREEDRDLVWRRFVNAALANQYQGLFARLDELILLQPPGFEIVTHWRQEQEKGLRQKLTQGGRRDGLMNDRQIIRFVQHFERITRHILGEMPERADVVLVLRANRQILRWSFNGLSSGSSGRSDQPAMMSKC